MSTLSNMAMALLVPPGEDVIVSNPPRAGRQDYRRADFGSLPPERSASAGIGYINQTVGGVTGIRGDAAAGPINGPVGAKPRDFTRPGIATGLIAADRVQGDVGRNDAANVRNVRATTSRASVLPKNGDVIAAFTNPALGNLVRRLRGDS